MPCSRCGRYFTAALHTVNENLQPCPSCVNATVAGLLLVRKLVGIANEIPQTDGESVAASQGSIFSLAQDYDIVTSAADAFYQCLFHEEENFEWMRLGTIYEEDEEAIGSVSEA